MTPIQVEELVTHIDDDQRRGIAWLLDATADPASPFTTSVFQNELTDAMRGRLYLALQSSAPDHSILVPGVTLGQLVAKTRDFMALFRNQNS